MIELIASSIIIVGLIVVAFIFEKTKEKGKTPFHRNLKD